MPPLVLPGKYRGAADTTDGSRDKLISEPHAVGGQAVEVRRVDEPITRATHRIEPLVVGEDEYEVGRAGHSAGSGCGRPRRAAADQNKEGEGEEGVNAEPSSGGVNGPPVVSIAADSRAVLRSGTGLF